MTAGAGLGMRSAGVLALALVLGPIGALPARAAEIARAPAGAVNLYRDRHGLAHLYATREEDAYFGLGYAQAEDRLGGLLFDYRRLAGTLTEVFGRGPIGGKAGIAGIAPIDVGDAVASDRDNLQARFLADARANFPGLEPQVQRNMTAFVAGIERFMADHPERVPAWAPRLEPALPVAAEAFMMGGVSGPPRACDAPPPKVPNKGSNIIAIAGARTTTGAAIFASDSHGSFEWMGGVLYPARIVGGDLDAFLVDITGTPIGLKGHGRAFGWGWAEGPRRPADCIVVTTLAGKPTQYRYDGQVMAMERHPYAIKVKNAAPVTGTFDFTRHNGVLSPVVRRDGNRAYIVSSAYSGRAGRAVGQFGAMLKAPDWPAMMAALARREIYPGNIAMAGPGGSILYMRPGRIPHRPDGVDVEKPIDGSTSATAWRGIRTLPELVQIKDPPQGYLTNENVSPDMMFAGPMLDPRAYPADFAFRPGQSGTRQRRAIALLEGDGKLDFDAALRIVGDPLVPGFERWNAALAAARIANPGIAADRAFLDSLCGFDGAFLPRSPGALHHALWRLALRRKGRAGQAIETAVATGKPLSVAEASLLVAAASEARGWLAQHHPQATGFGDVFRIGRGKVDAPARGITLLPYDDDRDGVTDFGALWAAVYDERRADKRFVTHSGTRLPFMVQFTTPRRSYSLTLPGISDDPKSPHYSDEAPGFADATLHSNFLEPGELAANLESSRQLVTGLPQ